MAISSIPTTRVSDQYVAQRLLSQVQFGQLEVFRLQNQISTGKRLTSPSDDSPAALRAMSLQGLLERKGQIRANIETNLSYLAASDSAVGQISSLLADARGTAIAATGSTSSSAERAAAAAQIGRMLDQALSVGNQVFRGRYLFAGSKTDVRPYQQTDGGVRYVGDSKSIYSYSDLNVLFATNVTGDRVFGGVSSPVRGAVDLNPVLTESTPLTALNGGSGVRSGSLAVSDGVNTRIVDISSAATIGDVARMLSLNPPAGRTVTARVTTTGLTVQLDSGGGGNLSIAEVGSGSAATDLGIRNTIGVGTGLLTGSDLNPRLALTTSLNDLLGTRASALFQPAGSRNDLIVEANQAGAAHNGATIALVDDSALQAAPGLTAGNEIATFSATAVAARASLRLNGSSNDLLLTANQPGSDLNNVRIDIVNGGNIGDNATAVYNTGTKTLTLTVDDSDETSVDQLIAAIAVEGTFSAARDATAEVNVAGGVVRTASAGGNVANTRTSGGDANTLYVRIEPGATTANQVMAAINAQGAFTARLDPSEPNNDGSGSVLDTSADPAASAITAGGSGTTLDKTSGLQVVNGGQTRTIDISAATTVEDLLNILNGSDAGLLAEINAGGTGIDIRSRLSGDDFAIGENGGVTATQLGVRSYSAQTALADLNYGRGVNQVAGDDFIIQRKDGVEFGVDISSALTVGDVLNLINNNATNLASGVPVQARLAAVGNGIELVNYDPAATGQLSLRAGASSLAANDLGLLPDGASSTGTPSVGSLQAATLTSAGANNDLILLGGSTAVAGATVRFVDTGLGAGNETVQYDAASNTLTFDVDAATTTANRVVSLLANDVTAAQHFAAALAPDGGSNDGSGLVGLAATGVLAPTAAETLTGRDTNPQEVHSVFTALSRLKAALESGDSLQIERAVKLLDASAAQVNLARAELGARQQGLDAIATRLDNEEVELKGALSLDVDVDLAAAISDFTARQMAYEAALQASGLVSRLSLLDFL